MDVPFAVTAKALEKTIAAAQVCTICNMESDYTTQKIKQEN
jgi:hypothetical protein